MSQQHTNISLLNTLIDEILNDIDDNEIENINIFNPLSNTNDRPPSGNYTIGRTVQYGTTLFNMINQLFDTSNNRTINEQDDQDEQNDPIIQFSYPEDSQPLLNDNESPQTINMNHIERNINNTRNRVSDLLNTNTTDTNTDTSSNVERILSQSLYDESSYKKKISDKGKLELCSIKFNKLNSDIINTSCPITQMEFDEDESIIQLPCHHCFTPSAIERWLEEKPECPVCRYELDSIEVKRYPHHNNSIGENPRYERIWNNEYGCWYYYCIQTGESSWEIPQGESWVERSNYIPRTLYNNPLVFSQNNNIHHRINLTPNSYLDYIHNHMDNNDFQQALILSYRETRDTIELDNNTHIHIDDTNSLTTNIDNDSDDDLLNDLYE